MRSGAGRAGAGHESYSIAGEPGRVTHRGPRWSESAWWTTRLDRRPHPGEGASALRRRIRSAPWPRLDRYRNLCIIAHIDHGKSTLADRLLELCGAVDPRDMRAQYLDSMDIERERGITIKLQSVRLDYKGHVIHLIDTPGHVDFGYEVSRSLAACEGAILLVDAAQGIEAQTLANCYLALEHDLEIVAALNKIDLPAADPDRYAAEIEKVLGIPADEILRISAKTGEGVAELLDAVIERIPPPAGRPRRAAAGAHLRLALRPVPRRRVVGPGHERHPHHRRQAPLRAGRRHLRRRRGRRAHPRPDPGRVAGRRRGRLPHRRHQGRRRGPLRRDRHRWPPTRRRPSRATTSPEPMVFCGLYPVEGDDFSDPARGAREAAAQRQLATPSSPRPPAPSASGSAAASSACCTWRSCASASSASSTSPSSPPRPSVQYIVNKANGEVVTIDNPSRAAAGHRGRGHRGAVPQGHDPHAHRLHRHAHGAVPAAPRRHGEARVPLARAHGAHLRHAAGRGRHRLLRPDEEPHPGLRQPRLRARRATAARTW